MGEPVLELNVRREGALAVIEVVGDVDMTSAPMLAEAFGRVLAEGPAEIELDCREMAFLDSSGIKVLLQAWRDVRQSVAGTSVYVTNLQPGPARTLEICGITGLLTR